MYKANSIKENPFGPVLRNENEVKDRTVRFGTETMISFEVTLGKYIKKEGIINEFADMAKELEAIGFEKGIIDNLKITISTEFSPSEKEERNIVNVELNLDRTVPKMKVLQDRIRAFMQSILPGPYMGGNPMDPFD